MAWTPSDWVRRLGALTEAARGVDTVAAGLAGQRACAAATGNALAQVALEIGVTAEQGDDVARQVGQAAGASDLAQRAAQVAQGLARFAASNALAVLQRDEAAASRRQVEALAAQREALGAQVQRLEEELARLEQREGALVRAVELRKAAVASASAERQDWNKRKRGSE